MRWNQVKAIFIKDGTELIRDIRTIIAMVILPAVFVPLFLLIAGIQETQTSNKKHIRHKHTHTHTHHTKTHTHTNRIKNIQIFTKWSAVRDMELKLGPNGSEWRSDHF